ncbi:MAG TPA: PDDEXK nuclease domain-containing protein [Thermoanaerobaculia bacterium]|nr:PDDEXK nuclease domain-containing protein [Thermoanaerobaculia bacterium]
MAQRKATNLALARSAEPLYQEIRAVLESARAGAYRAVNAAMVQAYWHVGRLIVGHEQKGRRRAGYGQAVISSLAERLTRELGRGFDERNLWYMRSFYLAFPILNAPRSELPASVQGSATLSPELSWTHYRLLLGVKDSVAREWYMREAADQHWSTRQLERQISVLYYERLLASRKKAPVRQEAASNLAKVEPEQFIRDPYVLEFLDLQDYPALRESAVEQIIIANLQAFLLELGKGFSFVAQQKRMRFDDEDFYVDLVFYNYLLKCFVLVDLKVGKLTHQDIGQMESYVRMFDAHARPEGDNPTIGLLLCSRKNEAIAKYSVLSENRQIFAAKYVKVLPTEGELTREIERERRLVDARHSGV